MYKLSFDLEPLTYMVHFQKDDTNATIRASELKPMFDRYLTKVIRNTKNSLNEDDYPILESYSVDEAVDESDYLHFDYQVRVERRRDNEPGPNIDKSDFFFCEIVEDEYGNPIKEIVNGKERKKKIAKFKRIKTYPTIIFMSQHIELIGIIQKYFDYFIAISFFGFRKGKGYGQFKLVNDSRTRKGLIKESFSIIGKNYHMIDLKMEDDEEVDYIKIDNFNAKLKTDVLNIIETPKILGDENVNQILKAEEIDNVEVLIETLNKHHVFDNINRETHLRSPKRKKSDIIRYFRAILGVADKIGPDKIICEGIDRFPNPVKYYVNYPFGRRGSNMIHLVIDFESIINLREKRDLSFHFSTESKSLLIANEKEINYNQFWTVLNYLLPKINFKQKPRN